MRILMQKRKKGFYCSWYSVEYITKDGFKGIFNIYPSQARNYAQAIRFWKFNFNDTTRKGILLKNSDPLPTQYYC